MINSDNGEATDEIDENLCEICLEETDFCECKVNHLRQQFEDFAETEYLEDELISDSDKPTSRRDLNAFIKLHKLVPGKCDIVMSAEHDKIWLDVELEDLAEVATATDVLYLVCCGVLVDDVGLYMHV